MQQGYCGGLGRDRRFVNYNKLHVTNAPFSMSIKVIRVPGVTTTVGPDYVLLFFDLLTEREKNQLCFHDAQMKRIQYFTVRKFVVGHSQLPLGWVNLQLGISQFLSFHLFN